MILQLDEATIPESDEAVGEGGSKITWTNLITCQTLRE